MGRGRRGAGEEDGRGWGGVTGRYREQKLN